MLKTTVLAIGLSLAASAQTTTTPETVPSTVMLLQPQSSMFATFTRKPQMYPLLMAWVGAVPGKTYLIEVTLLKVDGGQVIHRMPFTTPAEWNPIRDYYVSMALSQYGQITKLVSASVSPLVASTSTASNIVQ